MLLQYRNEMKSEGPLGIHEWVADLVSKEFASARVKISWHHWFGTCSGHYSVIFLLIVINVTCFCISSVNNGTSAMVHAFRERKFCLTPAATSKRVRRARAMRDTPFGICAMPILVYARYPFWYMRAFHARARRVDQMNTFKSALNKARAIAIFDHTSCPVVLS